jgi:dTDP-4-amino-4,6-dideoxygalactose transaminase
MAVKLLNLPPGSEIIVPSFTWISCAHAVVLNRCKVVFADVDLRTHNIGIETIEHCLTPNTKAIMVVHYAGKPVDMRRIVSLGYPIVEDAAHAVDSTLDGKYCGGIGDVGIYSFDAVKNLAVGEGGGLTARDPALIERTRCLLSSDRGDCRHVSQKSSYFNWLSSVRPPGAHGVRVPISTRSASARLVQRFGLKMGAQALDDLGEVAV